MFTAKDVMALREMSGAGMMDCKKALTACEGDMDKAMDYLREKSLAASAKKAARIAAEGIVSSYVTDDHKVGAIVEVNCETDFVAKTDDFKALVKLVIDKHREEFMYAICLAYCDIYRNENHISRVRIITAKPLPDDRMERIRHLVQKSFPNRTFEYSMEINPELIGGFQVFVDNVKMDASISNELQQLRQNLISSN